MPDIGQDQDRPAPDGRGLIGDMLVDDPQTHQDIGKDPAIEKAQLEDERHREHEEAFEHLREAVRRDDGLNYDEPWGWMQPARHALGALLLEQGHLKESEAVYREDLKKHPNNPWALHGLAESHRRQGNKKEFALCKQKFTTASERMDIKIDRSCFCRLEGDVE